MNHRALGKRPQYTGLHVENCASRKQFRKKREKRKEGGGGGGGQDTKAEEQEEEGLLRILFKFDSRSREATCGRLPQRDGAIKHIIIQKANSIAGTQFWSQPELIFLMLDEVREDCYESRPAVSAVEFNLQVRGLKRPHQRE